MNVSQKHNRVGVFGGSFNPVHTGHVALVQELQDTIGFGTIYVVPNGNPPHKHPFEVAVEHRLEMLKIALSNVRDITISEFETGRQQKGYAIDTINHFRILHPKEEIFFIIGADAFCDIPQWYQFPNVLERCSYLVASRAGNDPAKLEECTQKLIHEGLLRESKTEPPFRKIFDMRSESRVYIYQASSPAISSTEVRDAIKAGQSLSQLRAMLPDSVLRYLKTHSLYGISGKNS